MSGLDVSQGSEEDGGAWKVGQAGREVIEREGL